MKKSEEQVWNFILWKQKYINLIGKYLAYIFSDPVSKQKRLPLLTF